MLDPEKLASAVAVALHAAGLRAVVARDKPPDWTLEDVEEHYVLVRPISFAAGAELVGDGKAIADAQLVQVDLYQLRRLEDPARAALVVDTVDRVKLPGLAYAGRLQTFDPVDDPADPDVVRHLGTLRFPTQRQPAAAGA